jgi:hypothetical protein
MSGRGGLTVDKGACAANARDCVGYPGPDGTKGEWPWIAHFFARYAHADDTIEDVHGGHEDAFVLKPSILFSPVHILYMVQ